MELHKQIKHLFNDKQIRPDAINKYAETAYQMINEINTINPNAVLDLGCGNNIYKGKIKNLIGIDILDNNLQDVNAPLENLPYDNDYADAILALGSINFGDEELIDKQFKEMIRVSKPGAIIYFRVMPEHNLKPYYPWTIEKVLQKTLQFNLSYIQEPKFIDRRRRSYLEHDLRTGERSLKRIFCQWKVNK